LVHTKKNLGNIDENELWEKKICEVERNSRHSSYLGEEGGVPPQGKQGFLSVVVVVTTTKGE
jgi:hypothetical protein